MRINKEYIPLLLLSSVMYAANAFVEIQADLLLGNFIDNAGNGDLHAIAMNCIAMIILLLLFLLTAKAAIYFRMLYVKREMIALKKELLSDILSMRLRDYLRSDQAYYLNLMTNDADKMDQDYFRSFPLIIFYLCKVVLCIGYMLTIHWILLVVYAVLLMLPVIVSNLAGKKLAVKQKESSAANERFLFSLRDMIAGFETIKLGSAEQDASARFDAVNEECQEKSRRMHDLRLMVNQLNLICSSFAQLSCIALGGLLIVAGKITAGDLVNSMQLANGCFYAVNEFSERMAAIRSTKPISEKFTQLKAKKAPALPTENLFQSAGVRYEDVSFAFGEKTILSHFNYSFAPGKAYGIIGPSGSGKSTLVRLLMQYYDDYSGQITLDGADIRDFPETALYKKVKYVEQSPHLFNATLRENITLFHSYPPQEVDAVIQKANLTALAAQCGDAPIGDEGNKISGGERQRIALARALLEKPEVIVFDEPTSALDPVNTRIIMELIFSMSGYTRLVITHNRDREMLSRFDEIITFGEE